jgi:hypothetical protein
VPEPSEPDEARDPLRLFWERYDCLLDVLTRERRIATHRELDEMLRLRDAAQTYWQINPDVPMNPERPGGWLPSALAIANKLSRVPEPVPMVIRMQDAAAPRPEPQETRAVPVEHERVERAAALIAGKRANGERRYLRAVSREMRASPVFLSRQNITQLDRLMSGKADALIRWDAATGLWVDRRLETDDGKVILRAP